MYSYRVGYWSIENGTSYQLYYQIGHVGGFDDGILRDLVARAMERVIAVEKQQGNLWFHRFSHIHRQVIDWLVKNEGFTKTEYGGREYKAERIFLDEPEEDYIELLG